MHALIGLDIESDMCCGVSVDTKLLGVGTKAEMEALLKNIRGVHKYHDKYYDRLKTQNLNRCKQYLIDHPPVYNTYYPYHLLDYLTGLADNTLTQTQIDLANINHIPDTGVKFPFPELHTPPPFCPYKHLEFQICKLKDVSVYQQFKQEVL